MMIYLLGLVLVTVASVQARTFNNPILGDTDYAEPGAIKVDGTYYVVTTHTNITDGIFPIHFSTDLVNWVAAGYVFDSHNTPTWAKRGFLYPEIHKIGADFHVYFSAANSSGYYSIGVAIASHPLGPYTPIDQLMLAIPDQYMYHPTIMKEEDNLYLLWTDQTYTYARQLNSDGLSFSSNQTIKLLSPNATWEGTFTASPWYIRRGDYHYLLYSGPYSCDDEYSTGVARSTHALGPYEKLPAPIITANDNFKSTGHVSVVKDLDNMADVVFFQASRKDDNTESCFKVIVLASLGWDSQDWPYVEDF